ncbi:MAG: UDP-N-acetylmuramoyl-L-alanyl-D-glutamate--2,6-diaminopimelate ligase, partial [Acidobacteria bacterium]|nr:UDP-N-acetylmuramoyl-L-alanyl-D-glutamate--2,6-diaminopimelate ligase [Acidobacteriota bacterium]
MILAEVLAGVPVMSAIAPSPGSMPVAGLDYDSRRIQPDFIFFAFPGAKVDGRNFASQALEKGARAIVSELPAPPDFGGAWIQVRHGRQALAIASRNFYNCPDEQLGITGITGTNGKTTTAYLVDSILRAAGHTTGLIGTIEYRLAGEVLKAVNTTPESLDLIRFFDALEERGGSHVTMEVSSHALALARVFGIRFHTAVFSNLTRDHLDFHQSMEAYFAAKCLLFSGAGAEPPCFAVINADDDYGCKIKPPSGDVVYYGVGPRAQIRATNIEVSFQWLRFDIEQDGQRYPIETPLVGMFNVHNILAAWSTGLTYSLGTDTLTRGIQACTGVPGRFERVQEGQPFLVIVDYAHTDDAIRNAIAAARALHPRRVITVFGCGGDRDRSKRPLMGMAAAEASDLVVLTSDNPRSE